MEWAEAAFGLFGGLGGAAVTARHFINKFEKRISTMEETSMTKDKHKDLCLIASLEMKNHVSEVVKTSEDSIVERLTKLFNGKDGQNVSGAKQT